MILGHNFVKLVEQSHEPQGDAKVCDAALQMLSGRVIGWRQRIELDFDVAPWKMTRVPRDFLAPMRSVDDVSQRIEPNVVPVDPLLISPRWGPD